MKNKKLKWAIPLAIVALGGSSMVLTACKKNKDGGNDEPPAHVHEYTEWVNTDPDEHWKICPDDGEIDESTRAAHEFDGDGNCECGAEEVAVYGTVKGEVKLYKMGANVTDFTGIDIDLGDDEVDIKKSTAGGKFTYTVSNVKVGKSYTLTIKKKGYKSYQTTVKLLTENQEAVIGGEKGVTLEYEVFGLMIGWDSEQHDFSHVNDAENPYITFREHEGNKTLNVLTTEAYAGDVSASMKVKFDNSTNNMRTQGIVLKFEDGKHLVVRYHNGDVANGNIQYCNAAWGGEAGGFAQANTLFGEAAQNATDQESSGDWRWGEHKIHELTASEGAKIKADGADLKVVLKDGVLYTFFDGKYIGEHGLPEGYDSKNVQVGYFIFDTASNAVFNYDISSQVPAEMKTTLDIDVAQPAEATCAVTASPVKEKYEFGDKIDLTIAPQEGYILSALTVGGEDMFKAVKDGKLTVTADRPTLDVKATFVKEEPIALSLTVKGKKLGKTENLAAGTEVRFSGIDTPFTVGADGKITGEKVVKTRYTVSVDGYSDKDIVFDEDSKEIVLEYDTFKEIYGWGNFDFTKQNDAQPEFGITNDCAAIFTNDTYGKVKTSIYLKGENMTQGEAGLVFRFVGEEFNHDGKIGETVTVALQNLSENRGIKVQFSENNLQNKTNVATGCVWNNLYYFQDCYDDDADRKAGANAAQYLEKYNAGTLKLSVMRDGAKFYVFLDDTLIGQLTVDAKYADKQCEVGFETSNLGNDKVSYKRWKVEIDDNPVLAKAELTDETAKDAHGSVTLPTGEFKVGDTVEITIVPETSETAKYKLKTLTVNDVDVTANVVNLKYTFAIAGDTVVKATFEEIVEGAIDCEISGKKLGVDGNAIKAGDGVTLSAPGLPVINTKVVEKSGKLVIDETGVPVGTYTVTVAGYKTAKLTVEKNATYSTAIALEYETFKQLLGWGDFDFTKQNDATPEIGASNDCSMILTNDTYESNVMASIYLNGTKMTQGNAGVIFRFVGDGLDEKGETVAVRMEGKTKVQFATYNGYWGKSADAAGNDFQDLIFFSDGDEYLKAYDKGELRLSVLREGATFYVYVAYKDAGGEYVEKYVGKRTLNAKYENAKCEAGFIQDNTDGSTMKRWKVAIDGTPAARETATVTATATANEGSIAITETDIKVGDTVTVTVTPETGYCIDTLTVGTTTVCVDIDAATGVGTYKLHVTDAAMTVNATFTNTASSLESSVKLNKLGGTVTAEGTVKLTNANYSFSADIANGKITIGAIPAGEYTVSMSGALNQTITVAATKYETEIVLENDSFNKVRDWGQFDFSQSNGAKGKIGITNDCFLVLSKETYSDVAVEITLNKDVIVDNKDSKQGIAIGFGNEVLTVYTNKQKTLEMQPTWLAVPDWTKPAGMYEGALYSFENSSDTYLEAFNAGTLKLTVLRKGNMFAVYLNNDLIATKTVDDKYSTLGCSIGFVGLDFANNSDWKYWDFVVKTENLPEITPSAGGGEEVTPEA